MCRPDICNPWLWVRVVQGLGYYTGYRHPMTFGLDEYIGWQWMGRLHGVGSNLKLPPSELLGQLSINILIKPQSDVYERDAQLCVDSPHTL